MKTSQILPRSQNDKACIGRRSGRGLRTQVAAEAFLQLYEMSLQQHKGTLSALIEH